MCWSSYIRFSSIFRSNIVLEKEVSLWKGSVLSNEKVTVKSDWKKFVGRLLTCDWWIQEWNWSKRHRRNYRRKWRWIGHEVYYKDGQWSWEVFDCYPLVDRRRKKTEEKIFFPILSAINSSWSPINSKVPVYLSHSWSDGCLNNISTFFKLKLIL